MQARLSSTVSQPSQAGLLTVVLSRDYKASHMCSTGETSEPEASVFKAGLTHYTRCRLHQGQLQAHLWRL